MIRLQHDQPLQAGHQYNITDEFRGAGMIQVEGAGHQKWVPHPPPAGTPSWRHNYSYGGHYEYEYFRVRVWPTPGYQDFCFLKLYPEGFTLPSSQEGATQFATEAEAVDLAQKWLAAGGPGLELERPEETQRKARERKSAYAYGKAAHWLSQLSDADLMKLSEAAAGYIAVRQEKAAKAAAREEAKRARAAEKARVAAEKLAAKEAKAAEKARVAAEKARVAAEKAALKAAKDAEKQRRQPR